MATLRRYSFLFGLAGAVVALDQITKALVRAWLPLGLSWTPFPWLEPYLNITHWQNTGAAFGLFQSGGILFRVVALVVAGVIIHYYGQVPVGNWLIRLALALQLGGALGNLVDRVTHGPVTDFIHVTNFPIFNVADSSISIGVALLAISILREKRAQPEPDAADPHSLPHSQAEPPAA